MNLTQMFWFKEVEVGEAGDGGGSNSPMIVFMILPGMWSEIN